MSDKQLKKQQPTESPGEEVRHPEEDHIVEPDPPEPGQGASDLDGARSLRPWDASLGQVSRLLFGTWRFLPERLRHRLRKTDSNCSPGYCCHRSTPACSHTHVRIESDLRYSDRRSENDPPKVRAGICRTGRC